jgi:restriction endonuclease
MCTLSGGQFEFKFRTYREARKKLPNTVQDFRALRGDFEDCVAKLLREAGYEVAGTPATGDQGANLIARKNESTIAIQAKGYAGSETGSYRKSLLRSGLTMQMKAGWLRIAPLLKRLGHCGHWHRLTILRLL